MKNLRKLIRIENDPEESRYPQVKELFNLVRNVIIRIMEVKDPIQLRDSEIGKLVGIGPDETSRWKHGKRRFDSCERLMPAFFLVCVMCTPPIARAEEARVERGVRANALGFAFYLPETGFGMGGAVALSHRAEAGPPAVRPDSLAVAFVYTQLHQMSVLLLPDFYLSGERWEITGEAGYSRYPNRFYGIGSDTQEEDRETFTTEGVYLQPLAVRKSYRNLRLGLIGDFTRAVVTQKETGGILDRDLVPGSDGGFRVGIGPYLDWDGRDHAFYRPYSGTAPPHYLCRGGKKIHRW